MEAETNMDIREACPAEKPILRHLLYLCLYDYSEFTGEDIGEDGLFHYDYLDYYWKEPGRYAFLIRVAGHLAGFVLVRTFEENGKTIQSIAEFFVMRKYRRQGIGQKAAFWVFDNLPGCWRVGQEAGNLPAQIFWRKVISCYTGGNYQEIRPADWEGPMQEFTSPGLYPKA